MIARRIIFVNRFYWPDEPATAQLLTDLAEACTGAAIRFLLRDADSASKIKLPYRENPDKECGWIVLGMGKFGAR